MAKGKIRLIGGPADGQVLAWRGGDEVRVLMPRELTILEPVDFRPPLVGDEPLTYRREAPGSDYFRFIE